VRPAFPLDPCGCRRHGVALGIPPALGGHHMTWKTPKIIEVSLALEINSYACAEIG
jgi:coenzyme PQQ precursor peptide PqqA